MDKTDRTIEILKGLAPVETPAAPVEVVDPPVEHIEVQPVDIAPVESVVAPVEPIIPSTEVVDYEKLALEKFGYGSLSELFNSNAPDKYAKYDAVQAEKERLHAENEELLAEIQTVNNPFVNDSVRAINTLLAANPEMSPTTAAKLITTDFKAMGNLEKILLSEQLENPSLNDRLIKRSIAKSFGVDNFDDLTDTELDENTKDDIIIAAQKAEKHLAKFKIDNPTPDAYISEATKAKINERIESRKINVEEIERVWTPSLSEMKTKIREIAIPSIEKDDKVNPQYTKIVLTDAEVSQYHNLAVEIVKANGLKEVTKESQAQVYDAVVGAYILNNFNRIVKRVADKATQDEFARYKAERDGVAHVIPKTEVSDKGASGQPSVVQILKANQQRPMRD